MSNERIEEIKEFFNKLNNNTLDLIDDFYDEQVRFQDPIEVISGRDRLKKYYQGMYENVTDIRFDFTTCVGQDEEYIVAWTMYLKASGLNKGNEISLDGNSHILFGDNNKVIFHRDYFDMGEFIYEKIPILSWIIGFIKNKLSLD